MNMTESEMVLSMTIWSCAKQWRDGYYDPKALISDFDRVVFDHRIGEQLLADAVEL